MEECELLSQFVGTNFANQASQLRNARSKLTQSRRLPSTGWDWLTIDLLLSQLASFDSNNALGNVGVGEREGRIFFEEVRRRHYGLVHGIGRSGDIMAMQPKAIGSSVINVLTRYLSLDAIQLAGIKNTKGCCVLPVATGMAIALCLRSIYNRRKKVVRPTDGITTLVTDPKYVIWSRIDQKSCLKSIIAAGFEPVVLPLLRDGDELRTNLEELRELLESIGASNVVSVITTTSTFAPRTPDDIIGVAKMCLEFDVPHLVNNAYGLQCSKCCHLIEEGLRIGRVDCFVQSTDKSFLVPIGGAIVGSSCPEIIQSVAECYPGRASISPTLDLFMTLLKLGQCGWKKLLEERQHLFQWFRSEMEALAKTHGLKLLITRSNRISMALSLNGLHTSDIATLSELGSSLFYKGCSGCRVVLVSSNKGSADGKPYSKSVGGIVFNNYGSHIDDYPCSYLTVACAIGTSQDELKEFIRRLDKVLCRFQYKKFVGDFSEMDHLEN